MKKLFEFSPVIIAVVISAVLMGMLVGGMFNKPKETTINSSAIMESIKTAKLSTAKYIQHGIAKAHIEGQEDVYILYYATVKPNIDLDDIKYDINHDLKELNVTIPEKFSFDVELWEDEEHQYYFFPKNPDAKKLTSKKVSYICETDAKQRAEENTDLIKIARESLINTLEQLLSPIVGETGYEIIIKTSTN